MKMKVGRKYRKEGVYNYECVAILTRPDNKGFQVVLLGEGNEMVMSTLEGKLQFSCMQLYSVKEKKTIEGWVNVYAGMRGTMVYATEEAAKQACTLSLPWTQVKVSGTYEVEENQENE